MFLSLFMHLKEVISETIWRPRCSQNTHTLSERIEDVVRQAADVKETLDCDLSGSSSSHYKACNFLSPTFALNQSKPQTLFIFLFGCKNVICDKSPPKI